MNDDQARRVLDQAIARIARADYPAWAAQLAGTGNCAHPVRLRGRALRVDPATGETTTVIDTADQPDGVLLKACGTRRASRCPACAAVYQGDARALLLAGVLGGKGVPADVADRPLVFVTLTAPSFGTVHTTRQPPGLCQPGPPHWRCPHGRPVACGDIHTDSDEMAGQPICVDCYDHPGTIIWNNRSGELWRRSIIALRRHLGPAGPGIAYVKVVEYQRRGAVHFHALIRHDPGGHHPPLGADRLVAAIQTAITQAHTANPHQPGRPIRWGPRNDLTPVDADRTKVAYYLAKYATKSVDDGGALDHRLRHGNLANYPIADHLRRLAETAWTLGADPELAGLNLRHWAHTLGYRGHWLTKSRTWSTTLTQLRTDRHRWRTRQRQDSHDQTVETVETGDWTYTGTGHTTPGDTWLAAIAHHQHHTARRTAWEER